MTNAWRCGGTIALLTSLVLLAGHGCGPARSGQASSATALTYPETRRDTVTETIHGVDVADPYRWLEDIENPDVVDWLAAQDALARETLAALPAREKTARRLRELAYVDAVSPPRRRGTRLFYTRRHADREKAVHYWREGPDGEERVLLDPNTMSADGSTAVGVVVPDREGERVAYSIRENNADAATLYVMEVTTGRISDADVIEGAKYAYPRWTPDGRGFYYTALPVDPSIPVDKLPGEASIKFHPLGGDPAADPVVYGKTGDPTRFLSVDVSEDGRWLLVYDRRGWTATDVHVRDLSVPGGAFRPLFAGLPAQFIVEVFEGKFYVLTNLDAPRWRVLRIDPLAPARRPWEEVVPEDPSATIREDGLALHGGRLVVSYLKNAASEVRVYTTDGDLVRTFALPGTGTVSRLTGRAEDDDAYFVFSSFTTPARVFRTSMSRGVTELWDEVELPLDAGALTTSQVRFTSRDGTEVTMFLIHRADVRPTGDLPTLLYGYGGFNVGLTPRFSPWIIPWVERGGVYAVANLRGGSEYGEEWHRAGMLTSKQNVFDDFFAAAEWLIENGYTRSERLATYGRSNGGLLVGAQMTQRPGLARAVVCGVPLLDMVRYHLFGSGRTWISEYGSAEDEEQFRALLAYSPYHRVDPDETGYPALLMLSTDSDDRVDPLHARKFVAALQAGESNGRPVLLRVEKNAGHGGADLVSRSIERWTDVYAFLEWQLGVR